MLAAAGVAAVLTTSPPVARLRAIAERAAKGNGDPHPRDVRYAVTTRSNANAIMGSSVAVDGRVYAIALRGHFVMTVWHGPRGSTPPHGNTMLIVVSRKTLRDLDFALGTNLPLSKLRGWRPLR